MKEDILEFYRELYPYRDYELNKQMYHWLEEFLGDFFEPGKSPRKEQLIEKYLDKENPKQAPIKYKTIEKPDGTVYHRKF